MGHIHSFIQQNFSKHLLYDLLCAKELSEIIWFDSPPQGFCYFIWNISVKNQILQFHAIKEIREMVEEETKRIFPGGNIIRYKPCVKEAQELDKWTVGKWSGKSDSRGRQRRPCKAQAAGLRTQTFPVLLEGRKSLAPVILAWNTEVLHLICVILEVDEKPEKF